jgi:hypothetical protein
VGPVVPPAAPGATRVPAPPGAPGARPSAVIAPPAPSSPSYPGAAAASSPSRAGAPAVIAPPAPSSPSYPGAAASSPSRAGPPAVIATPAPASSSPSQAAAPALVQVRQSPLPTTGAVDTVSPQQAQQLAMIADALDSQDYFQVLQLPTTASPAEIKKSFYRDSRIFHPDRIFHLQDEVVKTNIGSIYKRITEAYYVLRDDAKRKKYLVDIAGPDRAAKLRYTEASEAELKAEAKKVVEEEYGTTPKGRQFFKTALQEIDRQQWAAAERNLKSALMYESSNAKFKEKLALVQSKLDDQRKAGGDSFKIK